MPHILCTTSHQFREVFTPPTLKMNDLNPLWFNLFQLKERFSINSGSQLLLLTLSSF